MRAMLLVLSLATACAASSPETTRVPPPIEPDPRAAPDPALAPTSAEPVPPLEVDPPPERELDDPSGPRARYTGRPMDIDVRDADIHEVFRLIATVADISLVVPDDVQGRVTVSMKQIPWDQLLDFIAEQHDLEVIDEDGVYRIQRRP